MQLVSETAGDCLVITVDEPRIDAAAAVRFKEAMRTLVEGSSGRVLLDMSQVDSIDSSGLGAIVSVMKLLGPDRKLELAALSEKVHTVFRLTRMDSVITVHASRSDALEPLSRAS